MYLPDLFKSRQSKDHKVVLIPRLTFVDQSKNEIFKVDIRDQTKGVISGFLSHSSFVSVMCKTLHLLSFGHFVFIFVAISTATCRAEQMDVRYGETQSAIVSQLCVFCKHLLSNTRPSVISKLTATIKQSMLYKSWSMIM